MFTIGILGVIIFGFILTKKDNFSLATIILTIFFILMIISSFFNFTPPKKFDYVPSLSFVTNNGYIEELEGNFYKKDDKYYEANLIKPFFIPFYPIELEEISVSDDAVLFDDFKTDNKNTSINKIIESEEEFNE